MLLLPILGIFMCFVYGADSKDYREYSEQEEYFMKPEAAAEYYIPKNQTQIPSKFSDILHFDPDSSIYISPTTTLPSEPLLYRFNNQYHRKQIPFSICSSSCFASESSISIYYLSEDTVESPLQEDGPSGYCRIDIKFKSDEFLIKTNIPGSEEYNQTIIGNDKCYFFKFNISRERIVQIQTSDFQNLRTFPTCSFKVFKENEPSRYSQILLKAKISDQSCSYNIRILGMGNFTFHQPPKPTQITSTKATTTTKIPKAATAKAESMEPEIITIKTEIPSTQNSPKETIQIVNVILYSVAGGIGISLIIFIIACICSRKKRKRSKKEKFQKSLTPKNPSMELDSTQTMPVKSSSQQLQVTQQLQPPTVQISKTLHTAKKKSTLKSNRVSKLASDFQHLPSKSQSRQNVLTLSLNQNAKQQNKKTSKGGLKEKKDSYGNTTTSGGGGHSKKVNQLKTASTLDRY